jgi:hypothetical protein
MPFFRNLMCLACLFAIWLCFSFLPSCKVVYCLHNLSIVVLCRRVRVCLVIMFEMMCCGGMT